MARPSAPLASAPSAVPAAAGRPSRAVARRAPSGCLAGLEIHAPPGLWPGRDGLPTDGRLEFTLAAALPRGRGWSHPAPAAGRRPTSLRDDGELILAHSDPGWPESPAACLRRCLPYASLLQGRDLLHAAAVAAAGGVVALVGAGGAGKSTLARALAGRGLAAVSDDLLPCRPAAGEVRVPLAGGPAVASGRLAALMFVERRIGRRRPALDLLGAREALVTMTWHGFGDLASPRLWRRQLDFHLAVARVVPVFRLLLPEGLDRLHAAASRLATEIARRWGPTPVGRGRPRRGTGSPA